MIYYDDEHLADLLREIRSRASEPHGHITGECDPLYSLAFDLIAGIATEALDAVAEDRPARFDIWRNQVPRQ
jgi:hypothetical protein